MALEFGALTAAVLLNGTPFNDVQSMLRSGETGSLVSLPWAALLVNTSIWFFYGILIRQLVPMVLCNLIGILSAISALVTYVRVEKDEIKLRLAKRQSCCAAIVVLAAAYFCADAFFVAVFLDDAVSPYIIQNLGTFGAFFCTCMYASPMAELAKVIRTKSTKTLSPIFAAVSLLCASLWCVLGIKMGDMFVAVPNFIGTCLAFAQFALFAKFGVDLSASTYYLPLSKRSGLEKRQQGRHYENAKRAFGL